MKIDWKEWHDRFNRDSMLWESLDNDRIAQAQAIVNDFKKRIREIEAKEFTEASFKQAKKAKEIIGVIVYISGRTKSFNDLIKEELLWSLDKETELAQTKLELNRMKQNNAILLKIVGKLNVKI